MSPSIDERIKDALASSPVDDQSMHEMVADAFRSKMRWWNVLIIVQTVVMMGFAVWALVNFLTSDDILTVVRWGALLMFCMIGVGMLKMWFYMQMNRNAVLREVKRVELQLTELMRREA